MSKTRLRRFRRKIAVRNRRWRNPVLARALEHLDDREIDSALRRAGLSRAKLLTPRDAIARHRVRMAHMLAALGIDVRDAVERNWDVLKEADRKCSMCREAGRCRRWLDWGRLNDAPQVFCPNAALFQDIGADQALRKLGRYLA